MQGIKADGVMMENKKKVLYMLVTNDEYELPLAVADNLAEIAKIAGIKKYSVAQQISAAIRKKRRCRYVRVEYLEGEL